MWCQNKNNCAVNKYNINTLIHVLTIIQIVVDRMGEVYTAEGA